jgi:hypothetical protein
MESSSSSSSSSSSASFCFWSSLASSDCKLLKMKFGTRKFAMKYRRKSTALINDKKEKKRKSEQLPLKCSFY